MVACRLNGQRDQCAGDDELVLRVESGDARVLGEKWSNSLLLAADWEPFALVERAVAAAAALSGALSPPPANLLYPTQKSTRGPGPCSSQRARHVQH